MKKCVICNKKIKEGEEAKTLFNDKQVHTTCFTEKRNLFSYDFYNGELLGLKGDMYELGFDYYTTSEEKYNACDIFRDYHQRDIDIQYLKATDEETDEHTRYIGFELETEWGRISSTEKEKVLHYIRKQWRHLKLVFEYDGSLNNGIEFISQPMTQAYYEEHKQDITDLLNYIQEQGGKSHDGGACGLHFHVSRDALGETKEEQEALINKLLLFIEYYKEQVKAFSRRERWNYCRILSDSYSLPNEKYYKSEEVLGAIKEHGSTGGHGTALNTANEHTIEFRFIRGTLNPQTFFASFYFVNNIIDVFNTYYLNSKKLTFDNTIKLGGHIELIEYTKSKGIYNDTPLHSETYNIKRELKNKEQVIMTYRKDNQTKAHEIYKQVQTLNAKYTRAFLKTPNDTSTRDAFQTIASMIERLGDYTYILTPKKMDLLTLINTTESTETRDTKNFIDGLLNIIDYSSFTNTEDGAQFKQLLKDYMTQLNERGQE
jgi:hypothetical protein